VALETIRTGSIKDAADNLDLSYQTAREALAKAMKRVGAQRLPGLVTRLTTLAFGVFPGRTTSGDVLADVWGLTERQISISGMLAEGASREQVAELLGVSLALVKKELDAAYSLLQVNSSAALARKLVEARVHHGPIRGLPARTVRHRERGQAGGLPGRRQLAGPARRQRRPLRTERRAGLLARAAARSGVPRDPGRRPLPRHDAPGYGPQRPGMGRAIGFWAE